MTRFMLTLLCLLSLASCKEQPQPPAAIDQSPRAESGPSRPAVDPAEAQKAVEELEGWDAVIEVLHDEGLTVQWVIGVKDDGSKRYGLAESVCMELRDRGLQHPSTWVRIVDRSELMSNGGDFRAASLGTVACEKGQWIDP